MAIYFIADTHFGHKRILGFERNMFSSIEEHDKYVIDKINSIVGPSDILYHLGDVGNLEPVRELNGRKILIMGNHDKLTKKQYLGYFAEVYSHPIYFNNRVLLSHYPEPVDRHILNIHGHIHGGFLSLNNAYNVSAHVIGYEPISDKDVTRLMSKLPKSQRSFLKEWFAEYYVFTDEKRRDVVIDEDGRIDLEKSLQLRKGLERSDLDRLQHGLDVIDDIVDKEQS